MLDPDREVQGAVRMVFDLFEREGTTTGQSEASRNSGFASRGGRMVAPGTENFSGGD